MVIRTIRGPDFTQGRLERIELNEHGQEVARESLPRAWRQRFRDVRQGPDGLLYPLTKNPSGALFRLEPVIAKTRKACWVTAVNPDVCVSACRLKRTLG